jgi:hypothetical protein
VAEPRTIHQTDRRTGDALDVASKRKNNTAKQKALDKGIATLRAAVKVLSADYPDLDNEVKPYLAKIETIAEFSPWTSRRKTGASRSGGATPVRRLLRLKPSVAGSEERKPHGESSMRFADNMMVVLCTWTSARDGHSAPFVMFLNAAKIFKR